MQNQRILDTEKESESGIASAVQLYVRLKNIAALSELRELRVNRLKFLSHNVDAEQFRFSLLRDQCQKEITTIDAGIRELMKKEPSRGFVDIFSLERIAGWAQYVQHPEIPVDLGIYFDNELVVQVVADRYRPDLEAAKLGTGHHSFEFVPSKEFFLSSEVIEVKTPNGNAIGTFKKQGSARANGSVSLEPAKLQHRDANWDGEADKSTENSDLLTSRLPRGRNEILRGNHSHE
jgi:hypothetical protein